MARGLKLSGAVRGNALKAGARPRDVIGGVGSGALRLLRYEVELVGHSSELGKRTGVHLLHRPAAMHLHGRFGNANIVSNLFAKTTASSSGRAAQAPSS